LDRFPHCKVEVVYIFSDDKTNSTGDKGTITTIVALDKKNIFFHKPQWGSMPRKASQRVIKIGRWRMELGVNCQS
jgi:hypothetical protein